MTHILIRNRGLAPVEAFTILGLSTARGTADKIGQFGSGSKHGILTLMRAGIGFSIWIGADRLEFFACDAQMGDKPYREVRYRFRGEEHKTGMCLEFGALDWDNVWMALREFICNALDQGESIEDAVSEVRTEPLPHEEETRVFISLESDVMRQAFALLPKRFMHYEKLEGVEITPSTSKVAEFFRRGVYVTHTGDEKKPPLFRYNFIDGRIDECRNLDGATVSGIAAQLLVKCQASMETIFRTFQDSSPRWEHTLGGSVYCLSNGFDGTVTNAWKAVFGETPYLSDYSYADKLTSRRILFQLVPAGWNNALNQARIPSARALLTELDQAGGEECEATETAIETFQRCWRWLELARLTNGKPFPRVQCFSMTMSDGNEKVGYYRDGIVFLNLDYDSNEQAALEELAHYITGAKDETRDFQDFAFKLATRLAKIRISNP